MIGLIFSFIVIGTLIGFISYFLDRFFRRTDITLVYMQDNSGIENKIELDNNLFTITYGNGILDESYIHLDLTYFNITSEGMDIKTVETVVCDNSTLPPEFLESGLQGMRCLAPGQNITLQQDSNTTAVLTLDLSLCAQDFAPDNVTCKDEAVILDELKNMDKTIPFVIIAESDRVDHYNKNNPIQKDYVQISFGPSFGFAYTSNIYFQVLTYETDVGYVFEFNNKKKVFIMILLHLLLKGR